MTSKFDMRPLAKASWLVALCLSPETLLPPALLIKLSYGSEVQRLPRTESPAPSPCHCLPQWKRRVYLMCTKWDCRRKKTFLEGVFATNASTQWDVLGKRHTVCSVVMKWVWVKLSLLTGDRLSLPCSIISLAFFNFTFQNQNQVLLAK